MKPALRLFIALRLPDAWREELGRSREQLASRRDVVNWVRPEHLHLTLRFLGDTDPALISDLESLLDQVTAQHPAPRLRLGEAGIFGPPQAPRVLWIGLKGELNRLESLVHDLERGVRRLGIPKAEHGFKAHLSLGRVKHCHPDLAVAHLAHPPLPLEAALTGLELIQSHLRPQGPEHDVLTRHILST